MIFAPFLLATVAVLGGGGIVAWVQTQRRHADKAGPCYEADDGELSDEDLAWVKACARARLRTGPILSKRTVL